MQSPDINTWIGNPTHFILFKLWDFLNTQYGPIKFILNVMKVLVFSGLIGLFIWKLPGSKMGYDTFSLIHELLFYIHQVLFTFEIMRKRKEILNVFEDIQEPVGIISMNPSKNKAIQKYKRFVRLFETFAILHAIFYISTMTPLLSPVSSPIYISDITLNSKLIAGWIPAVLKSYEMILFLYIISAPFYMMSITQFTCFVLTYMVAVFNIQLQTTLLLGDFADLEGHVQLKCKLAVSDVINNFRIPFCDSCLLACNSKPMIGYFKTQIRGKSPGSSSEITVPESKDCCINAYRVSVAHGCLKKFIKQVVKQHVHIKEKIYRLNAAYQNVMAIVEQTMVIYAAVPKLSYVKDSTMNEFVNDLMQQVDAVFSVACLSYCGQIILNESEKIRQALYNCGWEDKPMFFRRNIIFIMTVSNIPIKLSVGGMMILGMVSFTRALGALYSYLSFLESRKVENA